MFKLKNLKLKNNNEKLKTIMLGVLDSIFKLIESNNIERVFI